MTFTMVGFSSSDKRPMAFRETKFGQGRPSVGSAPARVVLLGAKNANGSLTADSSVVQVTSVDDAVAKCGAHSELDYMVRMALEEAPDAEVWVAPVAAAGGAVAASATILVGGTPSAGTIRGRIAAGPFSFGVGASDTVNSIATNLQLAISALEKAPATATVNTATTTVTAGFLGTRGNDITIYLDSSECSALTFTITGGTAIHSGNPQLVPLTGGSGADSVANVLALLDDEEYHFLGVAQYDVTNAALVKAYLSTVALPGVSFLQHAVYAIPDDYSAALALAASTLNDYRSRVLWQQNAETMASGIAAAGAALISTIVPQNPNYKWSGIQLRSVAPQAYPMDRPNGTVQKACLNNGITPLLTARDGTVSIQRGIITHCLDGTNPDYRALDWSDADVPDRISREIGTLWTDVSTANPYADADPGPNDPQPPAERITPSGWNTELIRLLADKQQENWVTQVSDNLPQSVWDDERDCIMSAIPVVVMPKSFQVGASVRQMGR